MGKLKRNRNNRKVRADPMSGKAGSADLKKDEKTRISKIVPLINNLKSTIPSEKSMAVGALTVLCEDTRLRKLCMKEKLVQTLMETCLTDNNDELVVESFGLLRNVGVEEGYDALIHMWRLNVWSAIEVSLGKIQTSFTYLSQNTEIPKDLSSKKKEDEKLKIQLLYDFTENVLSLVVALAEASDVMYDNVFAHIDVILKLVTDILNWNSPTIKTSVKLHNVLLDFIYEFSAESLDFIEKLTDTAQFGFSLSTLNPGPVNNKLGRALIEGIKYQIFDAKKQGDLNVTEILSNLTENVLQVDLQELKSALAPVDNAKDPISKQTVLPEEAPEDKNAPLEPQVIDQQIAGDTDEKVQARNDLQLLEVTIDVFTSAWELIALDQEELKQHSVPQDLQTLINSRIFPLLVELFQFDNGVLHLTDKILVCFNNLAWMFLSCESIPTQWFEKCIQLWNIAIDASQKASESDLYTQRDALNVCWAVLKTVGSQAGLNSSMITNLAEKAANLVSKETENVDEATFDFVLAAVGLLGTAATVDVDVEINRTVSQFLLHLISIFTSPEFVNCKSSSKIRAFDVVLTSLEQLIEIYSDGDAPYDDPVFVGDGYIAKLESLEPKVKEMYKKIDKNQHPMMKHRAEDVWQTLLQFILYKRLEKL